MSAPALNTRLRLLPLLIALGTGGLSAVAHAQSLSDLYTAARGYDAAFQAAKQQSDATLAKAAQAQALLLDAVKKMTVADAKSILSGPDDAATA